MTENQRKDDLRQFLFFLIVSLVWWTRSDFQLLIPVCLVDSSRHADEIPNGFNLCKKTIAEERGILMPLLMNGSAEMCTTTWRGRGTVTNVSVTNIWPRWGRPKSFGFFSFSLYGILSTSSVFALLCVNIDLVRLCAFAWNSRNRREVKWSEVKRARSLWKNNSRGARYFNAAALR